MAAAECKLKNAEYENFQLEEKLSLANLTKNSLTDEKRRLEARVAALEEKISNLQQLPETIRKLQAQVSILDFLQLSATEHYKGNAIQAVKQIELAHRLFFVIVVKSSCFIDHPITVIITSMINVRLSKKITAHTFSKLVNFYVFRYTSCAWS